MGLRARIAAVTAELGPRSKNILLGLARGEKQRAQFDAVFQSMLDNGELVMRKSDKRWAKYGPPKQRGFGQAQLILVIAVVGLFSAIGLTLKHWITEYGAGERKSGRAEVQLQWDKKKVEDAQFTAARAADRDKGLLDEQTKRDAAEQRADKAETQLAEAKREARRNGKPLVACSQPGPDRGAGTSPGAVAGAAAAAPAGEAGVGSGLRGQPAGPVFTWEFVREFDGGWTDIAGEPLSDLAPGGDGAERTGASRASAEDIADVAGVNAKSCSRDRRELATLMAKIERSAVIFDQVRR